MNKIRRKIADALKQARRERRITQSSLAKELGITQSHLSDIENGKRSLTAEQFVYVLQKFNLPLSYFVQNKTDQVSQIQNSIARLGGVHLKEDADTLPSERLEEVNQLIIETLIVKENSRLILHLVPVLISQAPLLNFKRIESSLDKLGVKQRIYWLVDGALSAINELLGQIPASKRRIYKKAQNIFKIYLNHIERDGLKDTQEDLLEPNIASDKTLLSIKKNRDDLATKWNLITRIKQENFVDILKETLSYD